METQEEKISNTPWQIRCSPEQKHFFQQFVAQSGLSAQEAIARAFESFRIQISENAEEKKVKMMFDQGKAARLEMSEAEKEAKLEVVVLLNEYLEVVMNFGYIIFFCVAFPLGPIIYWIFNILEIKGDAYKIFTLFKRPFPRQAENIGVWADIMSLLSVIGVISNTALMIFTANIFNLPISERWGVFIVIEHMLIFIMVMILNYYPKNFSFTKDLEKKQEILKNKYFYNSIGNTGSKKAYQMNFTIDQQINFRDNE